MSSAVNDDDFDFNSDDNDWGDDEDVDIVDDSTKILQLSRQDSIEKENTNTCWKCTHCENINSVNLTIEKEDMQCCGCKHTHYIPDETETFQCSKPHTHNDYLLRIGVLKKITVWICDQCTFKNENIHSESCEICQSKRNPLALITTTLTENINENTENESINSNTNNSDNKYTQDTYNHNYIYIDTYSDNEYYDNDNDNDIPTHTIDNNNPDTPSSNDDNNINIYVGEEWECCHCLATNTSYSECKTCGCRKPIKFSNFSVSELLSVGYIRQFANSLNILNSNVNMPQVICKLCHCFLYGNNNRFETQIIFPVQGGKVTHIPIPFEQPLKQRFLCVTNKYNFNVFGEQCTNVENSDRYRWRVKLKIDHDVCDLYETDSNGNAKIDGISIGIASDEAEFFGTGNIFMDYQFAYGIHGNGKYTIYSQFCPPFKENDVITLEFDSNEQTLSYGINDKWFGISHSGIQKDNLRLCVCVKQKGVQIECISVDMSQNIVQ